jgi:hypothetical protein
MRRDDSPPHALGAQMLRTTGSSSEPEVSGSWTAVLDAYGVQYVVLDCHRDRGLWQAVGREPGWQLDYQDEDAVLYARRNPTAEGGRQGDDV